jgi:hypothetical protein
VSFFRRWFARPRTEPLPPDPAFERADRVLDEFVVETLKPHDRVALERDLRRQRLAQAFHLGARNALAQAEELDETRRLALGVRYLQRYMGIPSEGGSITQVEGALAHDTGLGAYAREGEEAMRRWLAGRDPRAPQRLKELLDLSD